MAGLVDAKQVGAVGRDLSEGEAWHHYQAGQQGVVDSARFLITFSLVPAVQAGGSPLHIAASLGQTDRVAALLEDGARVDTQKADGSTALHCAATMGHVSLIYPTFYLQEDSFFNTLWDRWRWCGCCWRRARTRSWRRQAGPPPS